jgi:hypothetical protein
MRLTWFFIFIWIFGTAAGAVLDTSIGLPRFMDFIVPIPDMGWFYRAVTWQWAIWDNHRILYWLFAFPQVVMGSLSAIILSYNLFNFGEFGFGSFEASTKEHEEKTVVTSEYPRIKYIINKLEKLSQKYSVYINNLDALLGIKTTKGGLTIGITGLQLTKDNRLHIDSSYHWFIVDKAEDRNVFKVVGVHKTEPSKNVVYLLGEDSGNPFLTKTASSYIEDSKPVVELLEDSKLSNLVMGTIFTAVGMAMMPAINDACDDILKEEKAAIRK